MDHLRRLAFFTFGFVLAFGWGLSQARAEVVPSTPGSTYAATATYSAKTGTGYVVESPKPTMNAGPFSSPSDGCTVQQVDAWEPRVSHHTPSVAVNSPYAGAYTCRAYATGVAGGPWSYFYMRPVSTCPAGYSINASGSGSLACVLYTCPNGGTLSGSTCTVPASCPATGGWSLDPGGTTCSRNECTGLTSRNSSGACVCPTGREPLVARNFFGFKTPPGQPWQGTLACASGCLVSVGTSNCGPGGCFTEVTGGMGQSCTPTSQVPDKPAGSTDVQRDAPEVKCLKGGGTPGTVNGVTVCLDKSSGGVATTTKGESTTKTTISDNGDGTSTKTETTQTPVTTCDGAGSCSTTTSTTTTKTVIDNATGAAVGPPKKDTSTQTGPGNGTGTGCDPAQGPCEKGSSFGGNCAAGFVCDGDAVQCSIAREQHRRACQFHDPAAGQAGATSSDALAWFNANSKGEGLKVTGEGGIRSTQSLGNINTTARTLGGRSLVDQVVALPYGYSVTIPWSSLNSFLSYLGLALQAVALLVAARVVHGAALG